VQPLRPPQGAPHHRPRISDRHPPPMMPLRAPSSPHAAQRRAYSGELLDPDGPQINPCAALSLSSTDPPLPSPLAIAEIGRAAAIEHQWAELPCSQGWASRPGLASP
jgi:hypothetical protein